MGGGGGGASVGGAAALRCQSPSLFSFGPVVVRPGGHHYRVWYMRMKDSKAKDLLAKRGGGDGTGTATRTPWSKRRPFAKLAAAGRPARHVPVSGNTATDVAAAAAEDLGAGKTTSTVLEPATWMGTTRMKDGTDEGEIMQAPSAPAKDTFYRTNSVPCDDSARGTTQTTRRRPRKASRRRRQPHTTWYRCTVCKGVAVHVAHDTKVSPVWRSAMSIYTVGLGTVLPVLYRTV